MAFRGAVITFPGSNCDRDMAVALEKVSGEPAPNDRVAVPRKISPSPWVPSQMVERNTSRPKLKVSMPLGRSSEPFTRN